MIYLLIALAVLTTMTAAFRPPPYLPRPRTLARRLPGHDESGELFGEGEPSLNLTRPSQGNYSTRVSRERGQTDSWFYKVSTQ